MSDTSNTGTQPRGFRLLSALLFIVIIGFLAWLAMQLVQLIPGSVDKLASVAQRTGEDQQGLFALQDADLPTFAVQSDTAFLNTDEVNTLSWPGADEAAGYQFMYACTDGVAIATDIDGLFQEVACGEQYNLGPVTAADLTVYSTDSRYADVEYTVMAVDDAGSSLAYGEHVVTVVNTDVNNFLAANTQAEENPADTVASAIEIPVADTTPEPVVAGVIDDTDNAGSFIDNIVPEGNTQVAAPAAVIPISNPAGTTDLATSFLATGNIIGDTFFAEEIIKDHKGAVQFEVKNIGNKTSEDWAYSLTLPSGATYTSPRQVELKPNERAVITIGFPTPNITDHQFTLTVDENNDTFATNDTFTQQVVFFN